MLSSQPAYSLGGSTSFDGEAEPFPNSRQHQRGGGAARSISVRQAVSFELPAHQLHRRCFPSRAGRFPKARCRWPGNAISVNNAAANPLAAGAYALIQVAGGTINGLPGTNVSSVGGSGLVAGATASLSVNGGTV